MDYKVTRGTVATEQVLFDDFEECPVDLDFVLPDYCPDIAAVLKCNMTPAIHSKQQSGDRLTVDGIVTVRVLYLDEARTCIRSCENSQPFSAGFSVKEWGIGTCPQLSVKAEYVNCRATSPRRLDIHGAFSVKLTVTEESGTDVVCGVKGNGLFTRKQAVSYSSPAASSEKVFTVGEVLDIGNGRPPAEVLIRGEAVPLLTECKVMTNKVILKGILYMHHLYVSDSAAGSMERCDHEIPFSQIVDVDGMNDEWLCDATFSVVSGDEHISVNQGGESRLLTVSIKLCAHLTCYRSGGCEVVTDAYSAAHPLRLETKYLSTRQLLDIHHDTARVQQTLDLPGEAVTELTDVWCEVTPGEVEYAPHTVSVNGKLLVCMLAKDANGILSYFERPCDFRQDFDEVCDVMPTDMEVLRTDAHLANGNKLDLTATLSVCRRPAVTSGCQAITLMEEDEDTTFEKSNAAMKIYYASAGENMWEIAKRCHTSMEDMMEENGLSGDTLSADATLLIPLY